MKLLRAVGNLGLPLAFCLTVLVTGCQPEDDKGYPTQVRENFMNGCTSTGGTKTQCSCAWDLIQESYSYDEFKQIEESLLKGGSAAELLPIIQACTNG